MAEMNVDQEWSEVKREHKTPGFSPTINIRTNNAVAISTDFVKMANIKSCTHASLYLSSDGSKLAIKFHSNLNDNNSYLLGKDGSGSKEYNNRLIVATSLFKRSKIIQDLLKEDSKSRTFEPIKDGDKWVVDFMKVS